MNSKYDLKTSPKYCGKLGSVMLSTEARQVKEVLNIFHSHLHNCLMVYYRVSTPSGCLSQNDVGQIRAGLSTGHASVDSMQIL